MGVVLLATADLAVTAEAAPSGRSCLKQGPAESAPSRVDVFGRDRRVRGVGCGTATIDFGGIPQLVFSEGTIVLGGIGRGTFETTVESTPAGPDFFTLSGVFILTTARGTITFDGVGTSDGVDQFVGSTAHAETTLTAVSGTGRFEGVSGALDAMTTLVVTEIPDLPNVIFLDVTFTLEGTLSFPSGPGH